MIQFKLDENIPTELAGALRARGYAATTVAEEGLIGSKDVALASVCAAEHKTLITFDLDFSDIRHFPPDKYAGLMILRLDDQSCVNLLARFEDLFALFDSYPLEGTLWVIEENRIRIRYPE